MEVYRHNLEPPEAVKTIHTAFKKAGSKIYAVGGCIRDKLRGQKVKDWDMATPVHPNEIKEILSAYRDQKHPHGIHYFAKGESFGVISAMPWVGDHNLKKGRRSMEVEIATFRKDIGKGRRPESVEFTDMETDAKRRDLTINGMFYNVGNARIHDCVGGYQDIENGVVRCIGDPMDRFDEDPLRVLRFVRMYSMINTYDGFESEVDTRHRKAIKHFVSKELPGVSAERIRQEFISGLRRSINRSTFKSIMSKTGLLELAFLGLEVNGSPAEFTTDEAHIAWILKNNPWKEVSKKLNDLKYTAQEVKQVSFLIRLKELDPSKMESAYELKKLQERKSINITDFLNWAVLVGLDKKFMDFFTRHELCRSANEVPGTAGLQGREIGERMRQYEIARMKKDWKYWAMNY